MVWSIIGWFFLGLLGLLLLVLIIPSSVYVQLSGGVFTLKVRVLFVRVTVLPARPKKKREKRKKPEKAKKEEAEEEKPQKEKKKKTLRETLAFVMRLAKAGLAAMGTFLRHLRIKNVQLVLPVHAEEAADTAIRCGQVQIAIGLLRALLDGRLKVGYKRLVVLPDFTGHAKGALYFSCKAVFSLGIMFVMGAVFLRKYLALRKKPYTAAEYLQATKRPPPAPAPAPGEERRQDKAG